MPLLINFLLIFFVIFFGFSSQALAQTEENSFITIVNPIRISSYTKDPTSSLAAQYQETKKRDLPATWLMTYDALSSDSIFSVVSSMDKRQELGIFLEVTKNFSKDSDVIYNKTDGWQRATSVFLSGYSQEDRKKLVDKVFSKFRQRFGYFPKSVGGWWVDSFSLSYMKDKYEITGVLGISDQYDLDGYQLWGSPWSIPYYPSKLHAGIPAGNIYDKLDIVTLRWAARDPLNGYLSPTKTQASLYSVQDYHVAGNTLSYLEKLIELYSVRKEYNEFAHLTIGLEADYSPETYLSLYSKRLDIIKKYQNRGINIITMKDFSDWYSKSFPKVSPIYAIESDDLLGQRKRSIWVQGSSYRIGLLYDYETKKINVMDLRVYQENFQEPFFISPNKQFGLSINIPFVIDSIIDKNSSIDMDLGEFLSISRNNNEIKIDFEKGSILFKESEIVFPKNFLQTSKLKDSKLISLKNSKNKSTIVPNKDFYVSREGIIINDFSVNLPYGLKIRIERYILPIIVGIFLTIVILIKTRERIKKSIPLIIKVVVVFLLSYLFIKANTKYYVSQTEIDGLSVLSKLPKGKVLVYDKDCLRCKFATSYKPAAAAGIKNYVGNFTNMDVFNDYSFMTAKNSQISRKILKEKNIDYIYLAKYEDYIESILYLPKDLDLEKIYENGNVEIWKVE